MKPKHKCKDCGKVFGSGYQDSVVDATVQQCDEFEWCWDCDDKHIIKEIEEELLEEKEHD